MRFVVLDTSCVRGTSRACLRALLRRGFGIQISGLAFAELSVRLREVASTLEIQSRQESLRKRIGFLIQLLGDDLLFAPTHDHLLDKLGGSRPGANPLSYLDWLNEARAVWKSVADDHPISSTGDAVSEAAASYVEETGVDFVKSTKVVADLGPKSTVVFPPAVQRMIEQLADKLVGPDVVDTIVLSNPSARVRFDAHTRLRAHYFRDGGSSHAFTENHATDLNMLQHLADGLIVVTEDYPFVEDVDRCGTVQAPWVRTVGELLAGRIPIGPPFGLSAKKASARHRQRNRRDLKQLDEAGRLLAKAEAER